MFQRKMKPGPDRESVWDYPRPPRVEPSSREVVVVHDGAEVARSVRAFRVLETSHPPVYYIPRADVMMSRVVPVTGTTFCEFKGTAHYFDLVGATTRSRRAAWSYPEPAPGYEDLRDAIAFYPGRVDAAYVDGELVVAQEGDFYGGWITSDIVGPFKGGPGTTGW